MLSIARILEKSNSSLAYRSESFFLFAELSSALIQFYAVLAFLFGSLLVFIIHSTIKVIKAPIESVIILSGVIFSYLSH